MDMHLNTMPAAKAKASAINQVKVMLIVNRSIQAGDKICGRHGNKGVISKIVSRQDMPYLANGKPLDIILNPLSVPSRMNLGQILETNLGLISYKLGLEFAHLLKLYDVCDNKALIARTAIAKLNETHPDLNYRCSSCNSWANLNALISRLAKGVGLLCPALGNSNTKHIEMLRARTHLGAQSDQLQLYDGLTGLAFDKKTTVGIIYIFKLNHLVDNKIQARSVGHHSIITQQPLKSKAHKGGQRLGEMEAWALQSYGAAYVIKEMLTAKSDDVVSRQAMFNSLLRGKPKLTTS